MFKSPYFNTIELRQSDEYSQYMNSIGWIINTHSNGSKAYTKKIPFTNLSITKIQRIKPESIDLKWISQIAKNSHSIKTYIEIFIDPIHQSKIFSTLQTRLNQAKYKQSKSGLLSTKTLILDIAKQQDVLLSNMKAKTRYNIKVSQKHRLTPSIHTGTELIENNMLFENFYQLIKLNSKRVSIFIPPKKWLRSQLLSFKDKSFIVNISDSKKSSLLATALFLTTKESTIYQVNGSTNIGRSYMAPTRVIWEAIIESKKRQKRIFDFDGIYDNRFPLKRWQGFSRFKEGFGGNVINYPPSFIRTFW